MTEKIRPGEIRMKIDMEKEVWMDKKRLTIFALPISFTKYVLTSTRLITEKGLINIQEEEIMLYRVRDITLTQSLFERINKTGTVHITSTDATTPVFTLLHIKNPHDVKNLLIHLVEECRAAQRVRATELMDGDIEDAMDIGENEIQ